MKVYMCVGHFNHVSTVARHSVDEKGRPKPVRCFFCPAVAEPRYASLWPWEERNEEPEVKPIWEKDEEQYG